MRKSNQRPTNSIARNVEQNGGSSFGTRDQRTRQHGSNANTAQAHSNEDVPPLGTSFDPFARMTYIFNIAEAGRTKSADCYVDSGAFHDFSHYNKLLLS